jgi:L-lactate dehydrogenase complex protein LldG
MTIAERSGVLARFEGRCQRLGVAVHRTRKADLVGAIVGVLREKRVRSAMVADDLGAERPGVVAALAEAGVELIGGATAREAEPAEAGVSRARFAVAETGSVAVIGDELQPRLATMIVPLHVVVVDEQRVVPSLDEAGAEIEAAMTSGTRYVSLVTGPSRTADVEKTLAVGVHGPREVCVVLVEE